MIAMTEALNVQANSLRTAATALDAQRQVLFDELEQGPVIQDAAGGPQVDDAAG